MFICILIRERDPK